MWPNRRRPRLSRCSAASRPPPVSSGSTAGSSLSIDWVIAYTTGMPRPSPMLGRGSIRRPATIRPSTRRLSSMSRYCRSRSASSRVSHMNTEIWPAPSAPSAPSMTGMLNRPKLSVVITPTV